MLLTTISRFAAALYLKVWSSLIFSLEANRHEVGAVHLVRHHGTISPLKLMKRPALSSFNPSITFSSPETLVDASISALGPPISVRTQPGWRETAKMPISFRSTDIDLVTMFCAAWNDARWNANKSLDNSNHLNINLTYLYSHKAFSALVVLAGWKEGHPACL